MHTVGACRLLATGGGAACTVPDGCGRSLQAWPLASSGRAQQSVGAACLWQDIHSRQWQLHRESCCSVGSCLEAEAGNNSNTTGAHRSSELALYATLIASAKSALGSLILLMRGAALDEDFTARSCQNLPALDSRLPAAAEGHAGGRRQAGLWHVAGRHVNGCLALAAAEHKAAATGGLTQGRLHIGLDYEGTNVQSDPWRVIQHALQPENVILHGHGWSRSEGQTSKAADPIHAQATSCLLPLEHEVPCLGILYTVHNDMQVQFLQGSDITCQ